MGGGDLRKVTDLVESWAVQVASCSEIGWVGPDGEEGTRQYLSMVGVRI